MPSSPEFSNTFGNIRVIKVFNKFKSEHFSKPNGHIGITGKIKVKLQGKGQDSHPGSQGGNFFHSREILDKLLKEVPEFNIKLDPVGIMRNMKDDPYEIMKRYANRIAHFHAKDIFRYGDDGWEIEPIVGMGQLKWNVMLGMLWNVGYDGYIIIEPHGDVWAEPENRWKHIVLAKRHLEQYMIR